MVITKVEIIKKKLSKRSLLCLVLQQVKAHLYVRRFQKINIIFWVHKLLAISVFKDKLRTIISAPGSVGYQIFWQLQFPGNNIKYSLLPGSYVYKSFDDW